MMDLLVVKANLFTVSDRLKKPKIKDEMKKLCHIRDGAIAIKDGIIVDIGKTDDLWKRYKDRAGEILDIGERAILPGFIDPHTHAMFVDTRETEFKMRLEGKTYMEVLQAGGGILSTVKKIRKASINELADELLRRVKIFFEWGTTTFEAKSGYGLDFESEIKMLEAIKRVNETAKTQIVSTFMGAHAVPIKYKNNKKAYINIVINEMIPYVAKHKLAEFIDVFCEKGVYTPDETKMILKAGIKHGLKAKIHSDEIRAIGCTEIADELDIVSCDHLLKITNNGLDTLKKSGSIATLLPGTAFSLKERYAPARKIIESGIPVAIATDCNPGSSYTESMPMIITLAVIQMGMAIEEAVTAATINAAYAIKKADLVGSLDIGKQADFIILKENSYIFIPYHYGVNPIYASYKRGIKIASATNN